LLQMPGVKIFSDIDQSHNRSRYRVWHNHRCNSDRTWHVNRYNYRWTSRMQSRQWSYFFPLSFLSSFRVSFAIDCRFDESCSFLFATVPTANVDWIACVKDDDEPTLSGTCWGSDERLNRSSRLQSLKLSASSISSSIMSSFASLALCLGDSFQLYFAIVALTPAVACTRQAANEGGERVWVNIVTRNVYSAYDRTW
jgi:hypothetical protein